MMLKIFQARLQQYMTWELPDVQAGFGKGKETRDQITNIHWIIEKARAFQKNIYLCFTVKESACNVGDLGLISGLGRYPGEGNNSSILAWRIPKGHKESDTTEWLSLLPHVIFSILGLGLLYFVILQPFCKSKIIVKIFKDLSLIILGLIYWVHWVSLLYNLYKWVISVFF